MWATWAWLTWRMWVIAKRHFRKLEGYFDCCGLSVDPLTERQTSVGSLSASVVKALRVLSQYKELRSGRMVPEVWIEGSWEAGNCSIKEQHLTYFWYQCYTYGNEFICHIGSFTFKVGRMALVLTTDNAWKISNDSCAVDLTKSSNEDCMARLQTIKEPGKTSQCLWTKLCCPHQGIDERTLHYNWPFPHI